MRRLLVPVALVLFGAVVAAVAANVVRVLDATKGYETRPRLLLLSGATVNLLDAGLLLGAALLLLGAVELGGRTPGCDRAIGSGLAIALVAALVPIYAAVAPGDNRGFDGSANGPSTTVRVTSFLGGGSIVLVAGCAAVLLWMLMTGRVGGEPEAEGSETDDEPAE